MTISWKKLVATCFVLRQGGGRIFVTLLHFTMKKGPCLHYHNLQQYCTPAKFLLSMNSSYAQTAETQLYPMSNMKCQKYKFYSLTRILPQESGHIRESVDSLCRDGPDAQYMQYLSKSRITRVRVRGCVRSTMDTKCEKIQWTNTLVGAFQYQKMVIIWEGSYVDFIY